MPMPIKYGAPKEITVLSLQGVLICDPDHSNY